MTNEIAEVTILLPEEEAKKWMMFQRYYDMFSLMVDRGVFEQKNCSISLHFDHNGILQTIQNSGFLYSRKHEVAELNVR